MKLIMRADDLGFSEGVNCGILKAVRDGVITSVGLMPNMESAQSGYDLIKDYDIALGMHTNICAGKPVSNPKDIPTLVQRNGEFCTSREIRARKIDTINQKECEIEILAQLNKFREITGKDPDYFECHAVMSDNFIKALKAVALKEGLFYENATFDKEWEEKYHIVGIPLASQDEMGLYDPRAYMNEHLEDIKHNNCTVMIFHPGFLDQYILTHSSFTLIRAMECDFLCSDWLKQWIKDNNIELVDFREVRS